MKRGIRDDQSAALSLGLDIPDLRADDLFDICKRSATDIRMVHVLHIKMQPLPNGQEGSPHLFHH